MSTRDELAATLTGQHFDGQGCGGSHAGACSSCYGPSPMSAHEIADALIAEGWRKKPSREELAAALWNLPINGMDWRELNELAERDAADYAEHRDYVLEQADAILALMDRGQ